MTRTRGLLAAGVAALVAVVLLVVLRGGDDPAPRPPGVGVALARVPADAALVAVLPTARDDAQVRAAQGLLGRFDGSAIATDLLLAEVPVPRRVLGAARGGPLVVALPPGGRGVLAVTAPAEPDAVARAAREAGLRPAAGAPAGTALFSAGEALLAVDPPVVAAGDPALVRAAVGPPTSGGAASVPRTAGAFARATAVLRGPALVRAAGDGRAILRALVARAEAGQTASDGTAAGGASSAARVADDLVLALGPLAGRLRATAAALTATPEGLRLRVRAALTPGEPPFGPGAAPARPQAFARPVVLAVREPARTVPAVRRLAARRAPDALEAYDRARDLLRRFARTDLDGLLLDRLRGTATVALDGRTATLAGTLDDGRPLERALRRVRLVPAAAFDLAGLGGLDLDREDDGTYALVQDGRPLLRVLVDGDRVALSTDPDASLRTALDRPADPAGPAPGAGGLTARLAASPLRAALAERLGIPRLLSGALDPLGAPALGGRAETDRLELTLDVPIG